MEVGVVVRDIGIVMEVSVFGRVRVDWLVEWLPWLATVKSVDWSG